MEIGVRKKKRLGDILIEQGLINSDQLAEALVAQKTKKQKLGETLVELNIIKEVDIAKALQKQLGCSYITLQGLEIDPEVLGKAVQVGQKVAKHITPILNCEGFNLLQNNGEVAGQTIFHFHMHLIPRYKEESSEMLKFAKPDISEEEIKDICKEMKID